MTHNPWAKRGGHPAFKDMTGQRFGVLLVESRAPNQANGNATWRCRCDVCKQLHLLQGIRLRQLGAGARCPDAPRELPVVIGVESRPPNAQSLARAHQGTARFRRDKRLGAKLDSLLGAVDSDDEGEA